MSTKTKFRRVTRKDAHEAVAAKEAFKYNNSAHSEWVVGNLDDFGQLNYDESQAIQRYIDSSDESYVVYSYETPIAVWNSKKGWWQSGRFFSRTTRTHQNFVHRGIN